MHLANCTKCFRKRTKISSVIQPDGLAAPLLPVGPWPHVQKRTQGNTKNGGILLPIAETAKATVTKVPCSAEVMNPICFVPRRATILHGF